MVMPMRISFRGWVRGLPRKMPWRRWRVLGRCLVLGELRWVLPVGVFLVMERAYIHSGSDLNLTGFRSWDRTL